VTQCNELCNLSKINVIISLSQQCFIKAPAILRESQYKSLIVLAFIRLLMFISTSLNRDLRTVPTFASAHTFCASRKAWFTRHARAGLTWRNNYATKYTTKLKAKFSYCDQIKFNEPVLKPGTPEQQHIANHYLLTSSSLNTGCYLSKITLKSNRKHVPADGVVRAQNKCEVRKCFTYWGGDRKKCNRHRKKFKKGSITLKNAWLPLYLMLWNGSDKPMQKVISFWLWAKDIQTVF